MNPIKYIKAEMSDHDLSKYLFGHKWAGPDLGVKKTDRISFFVRSDSTLIATLIFDNAKRTRDIYLPVENNIKIK